MKAEYDQVIEENTPEHIICHVHFEVDHRVYLLELIVAKDDIKLKMMIKIDTKKLTDFMKKLCMCTGQDTASYSEHYFFHTICATVAELYFALFTAMPLMRRHLFSNKMCPQQKIILL